jgi:hypothetical protein
LLEQTPTTVIACGFVTIDCDQERAIGDVDPEEAAVPLVHQAHPGIRFEQGDMRALSSDDNSLGGLVVLMILVGSEGLFAKLVLIGAPALLLEHLIKRRARVARSMWETQWLTRLYQQRLACDEERWTTFQLFQLRNEVAELDDQLARYLDSPHGRFELWDAARRREQQA